MVKVEHQNRALQLHSHQESHKGNPQNRFLNTIESENVPNYIVYGVHPATALPNNIDYGIEGLSFIRDEENPNSDTQLRK